MPPPLISIIILNWNGWENTLKCLESVFSFNYPCYRVIIVDNGSQDDSVKEINNWLLNKGEKINNRYSKISAEAHKYVSAPFDAVVEFKVEGHNGASMVILLDSGFNRGYSGGNNVGLAWALASDCAYALVLNNDTIVGPRLLDELLEAVHESGAGVAGALIKDMESKRALFVRDRYPGMLFASGSRAVIPDLPWWDSDRVDGSAMFFSSDFLFKRWYSLGFFLDESFFLYGEELELGMWCRQHGEKCIVVKDAVVYHKPGSSSGGQGNPLQFYYITRNRMLIARKYLSKSQQLLFLTGYSIWKIARAGWHLIKGDRRALISILRGLLDGYRGKKGNLF